jgi:hypothetical protein
VNHSENYSSYIKKTSKEKKQQNPERNKQKKKNRGQKTDI